MKRTLLWLLAVLALCAALAACGGGEDSPASSEPAAAPTAEPTPEPTPTLPPYEPNMLTGEARDENYAMNQRPVAIMVNNIMQARFQRGISRADILVEIKVEGGITRFMGIFQDVNAIGEVGPVRSGRDQFFQLILPWQMLYVHEGESTAMSWYARDYEYGDLNNKNGGNGYRDRNRRNWAGKKVDLEHTMYTSNESIGKYIEKQEVDMTRDYGESTFFTFTDYRTNEVRDLANSQDSAYTTKYGDVVTPGEYIEITHSQSYRTRFLYDAATGLYKMQQYYGDKKWRPTIDEYNDGVQLSFPNIIVLFTDIHAYPEFRVKDIQKVDYASGGAGYYCYGGKCERIYWTKDTPLQRLMLYYVDENGQNSGIPLTINRGKTYLSVVDLDHYENFAHLPLSEVDVGETGSYAGTVIGNAASEEEIGEDDETEATPSPTPTPSASPSPSPSPTAPAEETPAETPTATPEPTPTATPESTPEKTPEPTPTATPEPTATSAGIPE